MEPQAHRPAAPVADRESAWIDRLPRRARNLAVLGRWDRPAGTWLLLLPCWWGMALGPTWPDPLLMLLFGIGAFAMRGAGCTINDLADRDIDGKVARTANRPLAHGRVGVTTALLWVAAQMLVGLVILVFLNWPARWIAVASLPLVVAYPFMKRITWWPQAFLGLTFNWGVLVGYAAVAGALDWPALLLYLAGIFWTLGYDTIYAHQDKEDDALVGVRSTARLFGDEATPFWLWTFYGLMLLFLAAAGLLAGKNFLFFLGLVAAAMLLGRQVLEVRLDDPMSCLAQFRANRTAGIVVFAALVGGTSPF